MRWLVLKPERADTATETGTKNQKEKRALARHPFTYDFDFTYTLILTLFYFAFSVRKCGRAYVRDSTSLTDASNFFLAALPDLVILQLIRLFYRPDT